MFKLYLNKYGVYKKVRLIKSISWGAREDE